MGSETETTAVAPAAAALVAAEDGLARSFHSSSLIKDEPN